MHFYFIRTYFILKICTFWCRKKYIVYYTKNTIFHLWRLLLVLDSEKSLIRFSSFSKHQDPNVFPDSHFTPCWFKYIFRFRYWVYLCRLHFPSVAFSCQGNDHYAAWRSYLKTVKNFFSVNSLISAFAPFMCFTETLWMDVMLKLVFFAFNYVSTKAH